MCVHGTCIAVCIILPVSAVCPSGSRPLVLGHGPAGPAQNLNTKSPIQLYAKFKEIHLFQALNRPSSRLKTDSTIGQAKRSAENAATVTYETMNHSGLA